MSASLSGRQRLERALAVVPWVAGQGGYAGIDEVCARFDLDAEQLQSCLATVSMVGVYPYTPDALLDVSVEPDHVRVNLPEYFTRPLRLTPAQTFGLLAAGRALLSLPGSDPDGPLARAIAKIAEATGAEAAVEIDIDSAPTDVMERTQRAIAMSRCIEIEYYSYYRDEWTTRVVEPWRVQAVEGRWYLEGHCRAAGATRVFRLDRIRSSEILEEEFDGPETLAPLEIFDGSGSLPTVVLDLSPAASWVASQYPVIASERLEDGRTRVTLAVSAPTWLERLLLRVGDDAVIIRADPGVRDARESGARRVLARYLK
jgi:proteasome accessory factor C